MPMAEQYQRMLDAERRERKEAEERFEKRVKDMAVCFEERLADEQRKYAAERDIELKSYTEGKRYENERLQAALLNREKTENYFQKLLDLEILERKSSQKRFENVLASEDVLAEMKVRLIETHQTQDKLDCSLFHRSRIFGE